ncbi:RNA polymerase sigma factor [Oceanobacillus saliphilus]|uniref:RNA polymerase sigma factor n=1 Tax=Oceanobacillus saliphilus TaxID=2925834 RepID=UPI00201D8F83|nr:sigma-70 family RNA polymerase sigma factor [Oceanobacillus saliphilus]
MRKISNWVFKEKKGKCVTFKRFVQYYHQMVYQFCYIMMGDNKKAEELANDTFLYAYSEKENYENNRKFELWLYQTAVILAKKQLDENSSTVDFAEKLQASHSNIDCFADNGQLSNDIQFLLMNLTMKQRLSLILKYCNQLSVHEICEVLDTTESEIRSYICQGREELREKMKEFAI